MIKKICEDKPVKSIVKAISWRIIASITTVVLVWIFTGSLTISLSVGILEASLKILFFYMHERVWNKIRWGKENKKV